MGESTKKEGHAARGTRSNLAGMSFGKIKCRYCGLKTRTGAVPVPAYASGDKAKTQEERHDADLDVAEPNSSVMCKACSIKHDEALFGILPEAATAAPESKVTSTRPRSLSKEKLRLQTSAEIYA